MAEYTGKHGELNLTGQRGSQTAAVNAMAPMKLDSNRRVQTIGHERQVKWTLITDADASDTVVTDYIYTNMPTDAVAIDGISAVVVAFCAEDTNADDDFDAYLQLWPYGNGLGVEAVRVLCKIGSMNTTGNLATGATGTTYYLCDDLTIEDQAVPATVYAYTNGLSVVAVTAYGFRYLSCQIRLDGGGSAAADAMCYALLPETTN